MKLYVKLSRSVSCANKFNEVLRPPTRPLLPESCVAADCPSQVSGFDFAGPLYVMVKNVYSSDSNDMNKCEKKF